MHVLHAVGTRPNFVKAAPVMRALSRREVRQTLIHTGQHYDLEMSQVFFRDLGLPEPDINLEVGSATHARQTADVMTRLELELKERRPDLVLVYGDVNSTLAAALVCAKLPVPVGHVEAGLRSFDRSMPEELNRVLTDQVSDLLFIPSSDADENLSNEGIAPHKVHFVGNVMIDTLEIFLGQPAKLAPADGREVSAGTATKRRWPELDRYGLVTMHRPTNVDDPETLRALAAALDGIASELPLIFPVHPRTRRALDQLSDGANSEDLHLVPPLGYTEFLALQRGATLVITDSGGIQEETTYLGIPCLTIRENTERPVTVTEGTNTVVGRDMSRLRAEVLQILEQGGKEGQVPPLWDGRASERIASVIDKWWGLS